MNPCFPKSKCCLCKKRIKNNEEVRELLRQALEKNNRVLSSKIVDQTCEIIIVETQLREVQELLKELHQKLTFK